MIILGFIFIVLAFLNPYLGMLIYMGFLYLRPADVYPVLAPFHVTRILAVIVLLSFLARLSGDRKGFVEAKQTKILLILFAIIVLSFVKGWIPQCLMTFEQMGKNFIVYFLIINLVDSKNRLKGLIWVLMIFSAILGFNTIQEYQSLGAETAGKLRLGGFSGGYFGGAGDFAIVMNIMVPFAFFLFLGERPWILRPVALFLMGIFTAAMICTNARGGGVIAFAAAALLIAFFGLRSPGRGRKFVTVAIIAVCVAGILAFAPSQFKERAASIGNYQSEGTALRRIEYWKIGVSMFVHNPLLGVGAGNYPIRYWDYGGWEKQWRVCHNMFIQTAAELGMGGILALLYLLYLSFRDSWKTIKGLGEKERGDSFPYLASQAGIVSLAVYCVGGMFQSVFTYPMLYIIIAIIVATKQIAIKEENLVFAGNESIISD